jgi:alkylation response protein AidB-like acyl-CoA dehydrogenase
MAIENEEQQAFRLYCREWLKNNIPPSPAMRLPQHAIGLMERDQLEYLQGWQKAAYEAGLVGCDYPKPYGGGRTNCQRIANEEMQKVKLPYFPNVIGLGMAAPTLFYHASEELKQKLLPKLFSADEIWCQGFSEPGAGSDLASVQTFAQFKKGEEKKNDKWIINGHKVWTSLAHFASWMILLARTDKHPGDKYAGMTFFVVPIKSALGKGVTVRPLIKATGETGFNEVLFENLEIDDSYRLDEVGKGWQVAMTTLTHERGAGQLVMPSAGGQTDSDFSVIAGVKEVLELSKRNYRPDGILASQDPLIRDQLMKLLIRDEAMMQSMRLHFVEGLREHPMRIPLQGKLVVSELIQDAAELALEVQGMGSSLYVADSHAPDKGRWAQAYINSFANTIAAGSSEVQRNILGERVLNLPKSK